MRQAMAPMLKHGPRVSRPGASVKIFLPPKCGVNEESDFLKGTRGQFAPLPCGGSDKLRYHRNSTDSGWKPLNSGMLKSQFSWLVVVSPDVAAPSKIPKFVAARLEACKSRWRTQGMISQSQLSSVLQDPIAAWLACNVDLLNRVRFSGTRLPSLDAFDFPAISTAPSSLWPLPSPSSS